MERYTRQRRHPRIATRRAVLLRELGSVAEESLAVTSVVGLGGCMICHTQPLGTGALVNLWLALRDHVIRTEGTVVWERPARGQWEIGVQFLRLDETDRSSLAALVGTTH